jgi:hypothetical protein
VTPPELAGLLFRVVKLTRGGTAQADREALLQAADWCEVAGRADADAIREAVKGRPSLPTILGRLQATGRPTLADAAALLSDQAAQTAEGLDPHIARLVHAMNRIPGLTTTGSCGGHWPVTSLAQRKAGAWYVGFDLSGDAKGWRALAILGSLPCGMPPPGKVRLIAWSEGMPAEGHGPMFELQGEGWADPDEFADLLEAALEVADEKGGGQ